MILVTGGAGFIGSHTVLHLLQSGYEVLVIDNLSNSNEESLLRVQELTGKKVKFVNSDVRNREVLSEIFSNHNIECVIHFAGFKAVGESVAKPIMYYDNNLDSTLILCDEMNKHGVKNIVFSSSATVYSENNTVPLKETSNTGNCTNPYGWTKYFIEQILKSLCVADSDMSVVLLRYFNPIGAHESGLIGEDPKDIPNNIMPYITQVAVGKLPCLTIYGNDYDTPDGTGVRDYIHVEDLAEAHLKAVEYAKNHKGCEAFNVGTGCGVSVLDLVQTFEKVNNVKVPYVIGKRRAGDIATVYSDCSKAKEYLDFKTQYSVADMCRDSWKWQTLNPTGYNK